MRFYNGNWPACCDRVRVSRPSRTTHPYADIATLRERLTLRDTRTLTNNDRSPDGLLCYKFLLVAKGAFAGNEFKILMEAGEIIKPAFITKLFYAKIVFYQQLAGMPHPYLDHELRIGFPGP